METLRDPLDRLADLVAGITEGDPAEHVLAGVVTDLERLAGAELAGRDEVLPVLVRRFARAQRLLLRGAGALPDGTAARLARHTEVLRDPLAALLSTWDEQHSAPQPC